MLYSYRCEECGRTEDAYRTVEERNRAPECCHGPMTRVLTLPHIQGDIEAYKSVAADKETGKRVVINSRKQHREFLKRNDYVEIGNEPFKPIKRDWSDAPDAPMVSVEEMKKRGFVEIE